MGLLDQTVPSDGMPCKAGRIILGAEPNVNGDHLGDDDREVIASGAFGPNVLTGMLRQAGFSLSVSTMSDHMHNRCSCPKDHADAD